MFVHGLGGSWWEPSAEEARGGDTFHLRPDEIGHCEELSSAMREYAGWALVASSLTVASQGVACWHARRIDVSAARVAYLVVHCALAALVRGAADFFPKRSTPSGRHLPTLLRSMRVLAVVFMHVSTMHWFSSAVQMMEAATTWPGLIAVFSSAVAAVTVIRLLAVSYVMAKYPVADAGVLQVMSAMQQGKAADVPLVDRLALHVVGGYAMYSHDLPDPSDDEAPGAATAAPPARADREHASLGAMARGERDESVAAGVPQARDSAGGLAGSRYEFTRRQERTFSILMDTLRDACGATLIMALASSMTATAKLFAGGFRSFAWVASAFDSLEAVIMAACLLFAVGCFSRILTSEGQDVELVMRGISSDRGLTRLFLRLRKAQIGAVVVTVLLSSAQLLSATGSSPIQLGKQLFHMSIPRHALDVLVRAVDVFTDVADLPL